MRSLVITFCFLLPFIAPAQTFTISGAIRDSASGEELIQATVWDSISGKGAASNSYGFYSLTLPKGLVQLHFSYVGYQPVKKRFRLTGDTTLNILLPPGKALDEVVVTRDRRRQLLESPFTGLIRLQPQAVEKVPVILGEPDLIKTLQLLPGVQRGHEGFSGMHVRGGTKDQNLILLDGVPVYNVDHLYGMFSVFHPSTIKDVKLYKGSMPARYRGRVSSVLDIRMKEGNMKEFHGEGSLGLVASHLSLEGPIVRDKGSFIVSARRTYVDVIARPLIKQYSDNQTVGYYFYDLNGKVNYKFSPRSRLYLSGYMGRDRFYMKDEDSFEREDITYRTKTRHHLGWGNHTGLLRWNYRVSPKLFSNLSFSYSHFQYATGQKYKEESTDSLLKVNYEYTSGVKHLTGRWDADWIPSPAHHVRMGAETGLQLFNPGVSVEIRRGYNPIPQDTTDNPGGIRGRLMAFYLEDDWEISGDLRANLGLNYNMYYVRDRWYSRLEPRLSAQYSINEKASVKASWGLTNQYLHLLTHSTIGLPTDLWVPATHEVPPARGNQFSLGGVYLLDGGIDLSLDVYYKEMTGLIEYQEGASFLGNQEWEKKVTAGTGTSYGGELFVEKNEGKTTGWISYTLSWANRKFEAINFGEAFPFKFDRRHVFNITLNHRFSDNLSLHATWVYNTGRAATLRTSNYILYEPYHNSFWDDNFGWITSGWDNAKHIPYRNNFRYPDYHRLDIGLNMSGKTKWGSRVWRVGLYNIYNRINPFYLKLNPDLHLEKVGIFPILPYVTYQFKF